MRTFMHKLMLASAAVLAVPSAASAAITLGPVTPGTAPYSGPAPTYDFESPAPVSGGLVTTGSSNGIRAQPFGSAGNYWAVGPSDGSPGVMDLASIGDIFNVSFLWGSVDAYNTIEFLGAGGVVPDECDHSVALGAQREVHRGVLCELSLDFLEAVGRSRELCLDDELQ